MKKKINDKQIKELKDMLLNKYIEINDKLKKGDELNFAEIEYYKRFNNLVKEFRNNEK